MIPAIFKNDLLNEFFWEAPLRSAVPRADIVEHDKSFDVHVELPGMGKENISVSIDDDILSIAAERKEEKKDKGHYERQDKFERQFRLTDGISRKGIEADYKDGVLTVTLKKTEKVIPQKITIK